MSLSLSLNRKPRVLILSASSGAAIRCNNLRAAAWKIATLFDQPEKLRAMKQAARAMAHPEAARVIAQDALGLLH